MTTVGLLLGLLGCGPAPLPLALGPEGALPLGRTEATSEIVLPASSRSEALPARVPPLGPLKPGRKGKGWVEYTAPLPFRSMYLGHSAARQPNGLNLELPGGKPFQYGHMDKPWAWRVSKNELFVRLPPGVDPATAALTLRYQPAYKVELSRNRTSNKVSEKEFVFRSEDVGDDTLRGVYVPAPGKVSWRIEVPAHARLTSRVHLLPPEVITGSRSDGATVGARVTDESGATLAETSCELEPGAHCDLDLDLVAFDSRTVTVSLFSEPGANNSLDYVFFEDPVVASQLEKPRQVVLLFVDTLRADRLGAYGYERKTPTIDGLGARGVVFENARSVSPWTLPATRAILTGRQPEEWESATTLAGRLSEEGWATTACITNAFLSRPFGMGRDWGTYRYRFKHTADSQVASAMEFLDRYKGRNQLLLLHFMDTHLPYGEPHEYRTRFAGKPPAGLKERFGLFDMDDFAETEEKKAYLSNRYDSTVRFLDDTIAELLDALDDNAIVILYSDHGEEFWEHGGIEHGHALWDEVVRVPLIVAAPGLGPARTDAPVSVMDIAPTLYDLLEIEPPPDLDGRSLVPLARGDREAVAAFEGRPLVFGRTLRNRDAWGLLDGQRKVMAYDGKVVAYDLGADPGEATPIALETEDLAEIRQRMSDALGRPFVPVLRIRGPGSDKMWKVSDGELTVTLDSPVSAAWIGHNGPKQKPVTSGNTLNMKSRGYLPNEIYLLPERPLDELKRIELRVKDGGEEFVAVWPDDAVEGAWLQVGPPNQRVTLGVELTPLPAEIEVPTSHEDMEDELKALGYVHDD